MRLLPRPSLSPQSAHADRRDKRPPAARIPGRAPAWQRRYRRHRRVLAALIAGAVVWGVVTSVRPPAAPTGAVLVARSDLVPGAVLRADDVVLEQRPLTALPTDAATDGEVVGRTVSFPVRAGEAVTARHVVGADLLAALGPGLVATPVALADPASGVLVSRGDLVDVLAATTGAVGAAASASVVASRVRVLVAPQPAASSSGSLLGGAGPASSDGRGSAALVLATTTEQALAIAGAAVGSRLSLTIRPG